MQVYLLTHMHKGLHQETKVFATEEAREAEIKDCLLVPDDPEGSNRYVRAEDYHEDAWWETDVEEEWYTDMAHVEGLEEGSPTQRHCKYCFSPIHADGLCQYHWAAMEEAKRRNEEWEAQIKVKGVPDD